jgi:hypothetical protein
MTMPVGITSTATRTRLVTAEAFIRAEWHQLAASVSERGSRQRAMKKATSSSTHIRDMVSRQSDLRGKVRLLHDPSAGVERPEPVEVHERLSNVVRVPRRRGKDRSVPREELSGISHCYPLVVDSHMQY